MRGRSRPAAAIVALVLGSALSVAQGETQPPVRFVEQGNGARLTDPDGRTLYVFSGDQTPGTSACTDVCAAVWPPLLAASSDAESGGDFSIIKRPDGARQWAYLRKPLYSYRRDRVPGDVNGEDVGKRWQIALRPLELASGFRIARTVLGEVLADSRQKTVYVMRSGKACTEECSRQLRPVEAPLAARGWGAWTFASRDDGSRQWAFQGKPLFVCRMDAKPGQTLCDSEALGTQPLVLRPAPSLPKWAKFYPSDGGELLIDGVNMRTLYCDMRHANLAPDSPEVTALAVPSDFAPVTVERVRDATANGVWSILVINGARQWAYKGLPLYTTSMDRQPGDLKGIREASASFQPIMRSGEPLQGAAL